mgnify:CR=1 FL=1
MENVIYEYVLAADGVAPENLILSFCYDVFSSFKNHGQCKCSWIILN